ncbi:MAG: 50S ribosomal protein L5 [Candidatus Lokiarchaeota archaeon]|nr:50S ribosomal protein L5 [Candidatus Lokiarchaeota archaeon]
MSVKTSKKTSNAQAKDFDENWKNPMKKPFLEKIVLNIGVGGAGEELEKAVSVLQQITGKSPLKTLSKVNVKEFNLRIGRPIGCKITIRGEEAERLLKRLLIVNNNKILKKSFDNYGNFAFGVDEHIKIPQTEYEAGIGLWGLDVCGRIIKPGMRVKYRRKGRSKIPQHHYVSRSEAQYFLKQNFGVDIVKKLELDYI